MEVVICDDEELLIGLLMSCSVPLLTAGIHSKNLLSILHLLVALARHFQANVRVPENVSVTLIVVQVWLIPSIISNSYRCCWVVHLAILQSQGRLVKDNIIFYHNYDMLYIIYVIYTYIDNINYVIFII